MEGRFYHDHEDDSTTTTPPENTANSPLSGDEEAYAPSPKKSRRAAQKKVVTVPIGDSGGADGYRSKGEVYPPPDSWSWRKYGQKPIKGSPYPRGYYRCSSSKGCPARKQVERSRLDPTTLLITYSCEHNHPVPTTTKNHHHSAAAAAKATSPSTSSAAADPPASSPPEESAGFTSQPDTEPADNGFAELAGDFGWLCDDGSTVMDGTTLVGSSWGYADVEVFMPIGEEDKLLFGDLGDLPESAVVFRRCGVETPCCGGTG